jgi:nucleoside-diphosphate-sugar epimerase
MSRILVIGGNGFIGREICRFGVVNGHEIRSVSRSGRPSNAEAETTRRSPADNQQNRFPDDGDSWVDHVEWITADLFDPARWRHRLAGCDAVIHTVGVTQEEPSNGVTFERTNGDSTIVAALEAERVDIDSFVFISVSTKPPGLSERYITAKRRAERALADLGFRNVILRPGPLYGEGNPHYPEVVSRIYEFIDRYDWFTNLLGDGQPLPVDTVAATAFRAATDPTLTGVLDIPTIRDKQPTKLDREPSSSQQQYEL